MKIDIVSAVPNLLNGLLFDSILKRGIDKNLIEINIHNLRNWTHDKHKVIDDTPYGGGPGMILKIEPFYLAIKELRTSKSLTILTSPRGKILNQQTVHSLLDYNHILILCGHYKDVDNRIRHYIDMEISIGDFILTGGEIPAAALTDAVCRLVPGVMSDIDSAKTDSFENGLLDCDYYTRPADFMGLKIPEILSSGNHIKIADWKKNCSLEITKNKRIDMYENYIANSQRTKMKK